MTLTDVMDVAGAVLLLLGALFSLVAAIGIVRLPDLLTRMHAATKPQVLGLLLVSAGLALVLRDWSAVAVLALVVFAQFTTAPVAAHMVSRASHRAGQVDVRLLEVDELTDASEPGTRRPPGS
jgi:multicomponent Na+:H+ antiporter subunit G